MKILMTLMGLDIGGAETHVMELAKELTRQGHEVILASNGGIYVPTLEVMGIRHVAVPMNQRDPRRMLHALKRLKKLIREEQPDLVHAHARIPAFLCGLLHKKMGFPFITSAHGVFQVTPVLRRITNWGQRTVAVSEDIKTYLMREYQVPQDQIHVTINGIDTDRFHPNHDASSLRQALGLGDGPVIMLVSRLDASSAQTARYLMDVASSLVDSVPNAEFVLVGGGDQEQALRLEAGEINRRCGRPVVHVTGPRTDIAELLSLATVFVGVSRAALEAMSEAKPVLLAGNSEYGQGYMGLFTPEGLADAQATNFCCRGYPEVTGDALLRDLLALLEMPEAQRRELGAYGRRVVVEQYSVTRMTRDYLEAYDRLLHPKRPVQAVISGYYGYGNLGDDAILCAIARQLAGLEHPVRLTVLSRRPEETAGQFGLPAVPRFAPLRVFRAVRKSDLLISGGGSLLQDRTSTRSVRYYLAVIRLAQLLGKPVFLYANGIGPLRRRSNRRRVCRCVARCDGVTLRDADSREALRELGLRRQDLQVTGDPAFTLPTEENGWQYLKPLGISEGNKLFGISVRRVPGIEGAVSAFARLCDRLSREQKRTIVFVVMQEPGDEEISRKIQDRMTEPSYLVKTPGRPEAILAVIGCMDAMVSMRLHTIIFAARQRVPVAGCVYDPKVKAFLRMLGLPSCGTPEALVPDVAYETAVNLLTHREDYRMALETQVGALEQEAMKTPEILEALLRQKGLLREA